MERKGGGRASGVKPWEKGWVKLRSRGTFRGLEKALLFRGAEAIGARIGGLTLGKSAEWVQKPSYRSLVPSTGAQGQGDRAGAAGGTGQDPLLGSPT